MSFWDTIRDYAEEHKLDWQYLLNLRNMLVNNHFGSGAPEYDCNRLHLYFSRYYVIKEKRPSRLLLFGDVVTAMDSLEKTNHLLSTGFRP